MVVTRARRKYFSPACAAFSHVSVSFVLVKRPRKVNFDLGALVAKFWKLMNQKVKNPNKKCVAISRGGGGLKELQMVFQSALTFH